MFIDTSNLIGKSLDWMVAKYSDKHVTLGDMHWGNYQPSTSHKEGGPIMDRLELNSKKVGIKTWMAELSTPIDVEGTMCAFQQTGPTRLIAAMRCVVASKFGQRVEVPDELYEWKFQTN